MAQLFLILHKKAGITEYVYDSTKKLGYWPIYGFDGNITYDNIRKHSNSPKTHCSDSYISYIPHIGKHFVAFHFSISIVVYFIYTLRLWEEIWLFENKDFSHSILDFFPETNTFILIIIIICIISKEDPLLGFSH